MRALFFLLLLAMPATAQVPVCIPQREGMTACFDGRLCRCRFEPAGQLTGRPADHRWDCSALRPDCRPAEPATPWPQHVPADQLWQSPKGARAPARSSRPQSLHTRHRLV
ncbi:MAG: hypothetical protein JWR10_3915 [Rubritepida sp.]|nr:hypothetical protein [Rubritepida sp.]